MSALKDPSEESLTLGIPVLDVSLWASGAFASLTVDRTVEELRDVAFVA